MTSLARRAVWDRAHRELAAERSPLINKIYLAEYCGGAPVTDAERRLHRHLERELNWYEMKIIGPGLDRLEARAKERMRIARELVSLGKRVRRAEEAQARSHRRVS